MAGRRPVFRYFSAAGLTLVGLLAALVCTAAEPALAAKVRVHTRRISLGSPFSPNAPCAKANPGFSPGYAQE
ncbi:MAG: hypothetical protein ACRDLL_03210, partial [Solirubrobacterales bacterium]